MNIPSHLLTTEELKRIRREAIVEAEMLVDYIASAANIYEYEYGCYERERLLALELEIDEALADRAPSVEDEDIDVQFRNYRAPDFRFATFDDDIAF